MDKADCGELTRRLNSMRSLFDGGLRVNGEGGSRFHAQYSVMPMTLGEQERPDWFSNNTSNNTFSPAPSASWITKRDD